MPQRENRRTNEFCEADEWQKAMVKVRGPK